MHTVTAGYGQVTAKANMEDVQDSDHMADKTLSRLKRIVKSSFSKLESSEENCRVNAAIMLIGCLQSNQLASENGVLCKEIDHSLKRLIRELGVSNASKSAGYFSVLVEILRLFSWITLEDVLGILENEKKSMNSTKKDITEVWKCQTLVIGALIHSNFIFKECESAQADVFAKLLAASRKKSSLFPYACSFLIDFIQKTDEEHFQNVFWPLLKPELSKSLEKYSLEHLHLILIVKKQFPDVIKEKFLVQTFESKNIINKNSVNHISKILLKRPIVENHPVYQEVFRYVCASNSAIIFWKSFVKESTHKPNEQKEEVLLNFLEFFLHHIQDKTQIPELLVNNFMEKVIKIFKTKKSEAKLAQQASEIFTKMSNLLTSSEVPDEVRISFMQRILFYPGNLMFDKLAGTKIVWELSSYMKVETIKKIAEALKGVISARKPKMKNEEEICLWSKPERIYAAQLYTRFLCLPIMDENIKWKLKQMKFLISFGLIAPSSREPGDIVNTALAIEVRNCFFGALDQKITKDTQLVTLLTSVVHYLNDILFVQQYPLKLRQPLPDSSIAAWKKMIVLIKEMEKTDEKAMVGKQSEKRMFIILFLLMGLQLFHNAPVAEEALQELHICYEKTKSTNLKSENKNLGNENSEDNEPYWVEVIVDLLLSLLSHSSYILRNVVGIIFLHMRPHLTATSVHQLLQVLDPHGKQALSNTDTEGDDSEDDVTKKNSDDESEKESCGEDDDDDDLDDLDDDLGNAPVDIHLKMAVHNALKKAGGGYSDSDEESIDMDQMTKEERNGLDAALSEAFKLVKHNQADQKRSNKKQSKDAETLMHFRVRVLDLLELYLGNQPALALVLDIILPLFELLEFCIKNDHQKPLENRVRHCLKRLSEVKHFSNVIGVDQELISVVLRRLLQKGERAAAVYQNMGGPLVQCSTFLARTSHYLEQENANSSISKCSSVVAIFKEALTTFFQQRDSLLPLEVFKSILAMTWKGSWKLVEDILSFALNSEIRPFRRHQALQLLEVFFSNCNLISNASSKHLKKLKVMEEKLSENTVNILQRNVEVRKSDSSADVKETFIRELLLVLFAIWQAHNRCEKEGTAAAVDWNAVGTMISRYWEEKTLAAETKNALKKLANVLKLSLSKKNVISKKRKATDEQLKIYDDAGSDRSDVRENGDIPDNFESKDGERSSSDTGDRGYESGNDEKDNLEETIKKRKRPKTNNLKGKAILKKQMKEARLTAMTKGLDYSVSFADIDITNFEELDDEKRTEVKKKRKHASLNNINYEENNSAENTKKSKDKRKNIDYTFPNHKKHKVSD